MTLFVKEDDYFCHVLREEFFSRQCRKVGEIEDADTFQGHLDYLMGKMAGLGLLKEND